MVSTRDRLKQTKEKLVSSLKIHRKPNLKRKDNLEMGDSNDRLMRLETTDFDLTSTIGELVEQLSLTKLTLGSVSAKQRGRSKKKEVSAVDGDEDNEGKFSDSVPDMAPSLDFSVLWVKDTRKGTSVIVTMENPTNP
ncbi:hypothetical protein GIB67_015008 [Kingdonia uniflora]|uniref:Uncharacterized protein n=1 Tax=Kingdonia uniflora TaxID=39325 RepID=A0A7J7MTQ1_9MAGN|nr:hypothetical protein GIB67_015008 [Kingdonia uniflora]